MWGDPKWFKRRKYTGWGVTPNTWQGWVYSFLLVGILMLLIFITDNMDLSSWQRLSIVSIPMVIILAEFIRIAIYLDKDEREVKHEALAERNVAWFMVTVISIGLMYQVTLSVIGNVYRVDPVLIVALVGGVIVKALSNWYLLDK